MYCFCPSVTSAPNVPEQQYPFAISLAFPPDTPRWIGRGCLAVWCEQWLGRAVLCCANPVIDAVSSRATTMATSRTPVLLVMRFLPDLAKAGKRRQYGPRVRAGQRMCFFSLCVGTARPILLRPINESFSARPSLRHPDAAAHGGIVGGDCRVARHRHRRQHRHLPRR